MLNMKQTLSMFFKRCGYDVTRIHDFHGEIDRMPLLDTFVGSDGREYRRLNGYRDFQVPGWHQMFEPPQPPTVDVQSQRQALRKLENFLNVYDFSIKGKDVLEVGCHNGATACAIGELASHVDAIDISSYGVRQSSPGEPEDSRLARQSGLLDEWRAASRTAFNGIANVDFHEQDVVAMQKSECYDLVVSWETFEHIGDPAKALANIFRSLRPGGVTFHEYNPFYSLAGGHSLCTLDFPYGHARLPAGDFANYINRYRPEEAGVAMNFYNHLLNRMTMHDLVKYSTAASFEVVAICPWINRDHLSIVTREVLDDCRKNKPNVTVNDLASPFVWVLLQKPKSLV